MDTVEKIHSELESCLKGINSGGLSNLDAKIIEKLEKIVPAAAGLGMEQGKKLTENLSEVLKTFKEGKSNESSVAVRITALDFYLQNIKGTDSTEEL